MKTAFVIFILSAVTALAQTGVRAVIGEAADQPYAVKLAIAGALRNRGNFKGVIGLKNSKMIDAQSVTTWTEATRAWNESATNNTAHSATHFENVKRFGVPYWANTKSPVLKMGGIYFYKLP